MNESLCLDKKSPGVPSLSISARVPRHVAGVFTELMGGQLGIGSSRLGDQRPNLP